MSEVGFLTPDHSPGELCRVLSHALAELRVTHGITHSGRSGHEAGHTLPARPSARRTPEPPAVEADPLDAEWIQRERELRRERAARDAAEASAKPAGPTVPEVLEACGISDELAAEIVRSGVSAALARTIAEASKAAAVKAAAIERGELDQDVAAARATCKPAAPAAVLDAHRLAERSRAGSAPLQAQPAEDEQPPPPEEENPAPPRGSRRGRARELQVERANKWRAAYYAKCAARGIKIEDAPPNVPEGAYRMGQSVLSDWYGTRTPKIIEREARRRTGYPFAMLRQCIGDAPDFTDYKTREVVAAALLLLALSARGRRKGKWQSFVCGHSVNSLAAALHHPSSPERRLSRNAFGGGGRKRPEHRLAAAAARWRGYVRKRPPKKQTDPILRRLRDAGFLYGQQLPAACVKRFERDPRPGNEHHVRNRYWLATLTVPIGARRRKGALTALGGALSALWADEFKQFDALGWEWIDGCKRDKSPTAQPP